MYRLAVKYTEKRTDDNPSGRRRGIRYRPKQSYRHLNDTAQKQPQRQVGG